ncbi:hypothetical protein BH10BAC2_BH10BAC2_48330 [soil metagenome]
MIAEICFLFQQSCFLSGNCGNEKIETKNLKMSEDLKYGFGFWEWE